MRSGLSDPTDGPARREALATMVDTELASLWEAITEGHPGVPDEGLALVAVGSHARRDAGPASDLDLVLLHDNRTLRPDQLTALADSLWYPLWDSGVRIDHSVRSVAECASVAGQDLAAAIGMLDLRPIAGDGSLALRTREMLREQWRKNARNRLTDIADSLAERTHLHGELAYLIEGDLKEARGGLRDVVVLQALVATWLTDLPHGPALTAAADRLLDVRDGLHAVTGKPTERLLMAEQDAVAVALGLDDADALLAVVCEAARTIRYSLDLSLRRARGATSRRRGLRRRRPQLRQLEPGLVEHEGELCLSAQAQPATERTLAVRAAAAAAWNGLPLSPITAGHLAHGLAEQTTNWRFRQPGTDQDADDGAWSDRGREALLRLLGSGENLVGVWETLDQAGLVTQWFPEWAGVRNRPQRNAVHRHTVDRHLIQTCVEAASMADRVSRPDLLLVAALLHDIGKRAGAADHSEVGAPIAHRITLRLGFGQDEALLVERLVAEHLTLVELATRRDPDDPRTVEALLGAVDHREDVLDLLRALTEADARSAGPAAWTPWRRRLVDDLMSRARRRLAGQPAPGPSPLTPDEESLVRAAREAGDVSVVLTEMDEAKAVTVVAPDRLGLFADVAGLLAANGLTVRSALVRTVHGVAVDTWYVDSGYNTADPAVLRTGLLRLAEGDQQPLARLARREAAWRPGRITDAGGLAPRVIVVPDASTDATVLEIRAVDRPGLLHALGRTLHDLRVDVRSAHVATHAGRAVDVLYLGEADPSGTGPKLSAARTGSVVAGLMAAAVWEGH